VKKVKFLNFAGKKAGKVSPEKQKACFLLTIFDCRLTIFDAGFWILDVNGQSLISNPLKMNSSWPFALFVVNLSQKSSFTP
jgi:hypothetical protein